MKYLVLAATVTAGVRLASSAWEDPFLVSTGTPDGLLGALSQPPGSGKLETETADAFMLTETTRIAQATITGLIPSVPQLANISDVEADLYHVFPADSTPPASRNVTSRVNSPADVEIDDATRDGSLRTLDFTASLLNPSFAVANTVVNGINKAPTSTTPGDGPATGEEVQITHPDPCAGGSLLLPPGGPGDRWRFSVPVGAEAVRADVGRQRLSTPPP